LSIHFLLLTSCVAMRHVRPQRRASASILRMRTQILLTLRTWRKTNFFTAMFLLSSNNNITKFKLHLQFFAHATLLKTGPWFQYILNIITVVASADVDARWLRFADADATL